MELVQWLEDMANELEGASGVPRTDAIQKEWGLDDHALFIYRKRGDIEEVIRLEWVHGERLPRWRVAFENIIDDDEELDHESSPSEEQED